MNRIKSALEIALEKTEKQLKTAGEGTAFNEEQEYIKAAAVLGRAFLEGKAGKEEIEEIRDKLSRYPERIRESAVRAFIAELSLNMNMENTLQVLEAIKHLKNDQLTEDACAAAAQLFQHYRRRLAESRSLMENTTTRVQQLKFERIGIKGNAIAGYNLQGLAAWREMEAQFAEEYRRVLENFRNAVIA